MNKKSVFVVLFFIYMHSLAIAQDFRSITADELKGMLDNKVKLVLVDARTGLEYGQGHISQAINIPPEKVGSLAEVLPKNRKILVVFYCRGAG
jgi:rhodanese-related sulfurtransferase